MAWPNPVLCSISPELIQKLRQPGGWVILGPSRLYLQADNTLVCETISVADAVAYMSNHPTWPDECREFGCDDEQEP